MYKAFLLAGAMLLPGPKVPEAHLKPPARASEPSTAHVEQTKQLTPEDYYKPLDAYLANTPMAGTGRYFWETEQRTGVKKELLMAIAFAETSYNRNPQRGSQFNAFSICSYDSTSTTCHYGSYAEAIDAAAFYLTDPRTPLGSMSYHTVGDLSRAGNCCGPIWASSPSNWQRNVLSEISNITGKPADPSWAWRTR